MSHTPPWATLIFAVMFFMTAQLVGIEIRIEKSKKPFDYCIKYLAWGIGFYLAIVAIRADGSFIP